MHFYEVDVLIDEGGVSKMLTYSSVEPVAENIIVEVPYGKKNIFGIINKPSGKPKFATKPITKVVDSTPVPTEWRNLLSWFRKFYPIKHNEISSLFLPAFLKTLNKNQGNVPAKKNTIKELSLTDEQELAIKTIQQSTKPVLLHGDMGSGKTQVYLEATLRTLKEGRSVLLLAPEIPLSTQLYLQARDFLGEFQVIIYHSELKLTDRRDVWKQCLENKQPVVVVGTRSSLFLPLHNLGLVCVDELHENSYHQQENPHYHGVDVAAELSKLHKSKIVYGSATPPIKEHFIAVQKQYPIVRMTSQAASKNASERSIEIVDQRIRNNFSRDPYLSDSLIHAIEDAFASGLQSLIFHNRRGTARTVLCDRCGWALICQRCDIGMVYHHDSHTCRCHICGRTESLPNTCPECGNRDLLLRGVGVKALEERLKTLFPTARIARFDSDNVKSESLSSRINELKRGDIDIAIGTQLVAKGLDLKNLRVVGIANADSSLHLPDYTSSERMFQLIAQTIGRVGRGHRDGICIIQTYQPDNPIFNHLKKVDWSSFYESELQERKLFNYPPFVYLLKLSCRRRTEAGAERAAQKFADSLRSKTRVQIIGPSPSFFGKSGGLYEWQIIVKSRSRSGLLEIARNIPSNWQAELDPTGLL